MSQYYGLTKNLKQEKNSKSKWENDESREDFKKKDELKETFKNIEIVKNQT